MQIQVCPLRSHKKKIITLNVPRFNSDGPQNSEFSYFNFQDLDPKFVLALEARVLKLEVRHLESGPIYHCKPMQLLFVFIWAD